MMDAEEYLGRSRLFRRLKSGPHGQLVELYAARLVKDGLARHGTWRCLNVVGGLLSWIAEPRSKLTDLDERMVERYLRHRARKQSHPAGRPGGAEAVAVGAARGGHDRAGGAAADHPAGPDIRGVQRLSAKRNAVWRRSPSSATCRSSAGSCVRCALPAPATSARSARRTSSATSSATPGIGARCPARRCAGRCAHFSDTSIIEG